MTAFPGLHVRYLILCSSLQEWESFQQDFRKKSRIFTKFMLRPTHRSHSVAQRGTFLIWPVLLSSASPPAALLGAPDPPETCNYCNCSETQTQHAIFPPFKAGCRVQLPRKPFLPLSDLDNFVQPCLILSETRIWDAKGKKPKTTKFLRCLTASAGAAPPQVSWVAACDSRARAGPLLPVLLLYTGIFISKCGFLGPVPWNDHSVSPTWNLGKSAFSKSTLAVQVVRYGTPFSMSHWPDPEPFFLLSRTGPYRTVGHP